MYTWRRERERERERERVAVAHLFEYLDEPGGEALG